jgi:hypothetical protein
MTIAATPHSTDRTDRILLGSCAGIWLAALGAAVAATVALVDLANGRTDTGDSGTPWFLYVVIGVSAAVIVAAVPLLLRARRETAAGAAPEAEPAPRPAESSAAPAARPRIVEAPTEKIRAVRPAPSPLREPATSPVAEQLGLRCAASIGCAMGVATLLIGVGTYLMAIENDVVAWVLLGAAGVVTVGMIAIPVYFLRELRGALDA